MKINNHHLEVKKGTSMNVIWYPPLLINQPLMHGEENAIWYNQSFILDTFQHNRDLLITSLK